MAALEKHIVINFSSIIKIHTYLRVHTSPKTFWHQILVVVLNSLKSTGCPKKVYSSKSSRIQMWSSVMTYIFQTLFRKCLCRFVQNPYSMFYLSYERQKMVVSNMALQSLTSSYDLPAYTPGQNSFNRPVFSSLSYSFHVIIACKLN